jgi:hypothetical protein
MGAAMHDTTPLRIHCQEPIDIPRESGLRIAVIADGNGRRGRDGHASGARNVVACAEHCRDRGDVALFCALLLSPENVEKRGQRFFATMHALFVGLVADVVRGRALAGVHCELYGRLDRLKRRGGAARRLAHAIELLLDAGGAHEPRLRFVIGVDYDDEIIPALHLDLVVRTGMESGGVIRLSGLRGHPSAACFATMKLWCEFGPRDLDEAVAASERCLPAAFSPGYDAAFVAAFIDELLDASIAAPLRLVLPVAAPEPALVAALGRLVRGRLGAQDRLSVDYAMHGARRLRRFGPGGETRQSILLVSPSRRRAMESEGRSALLLPGQPSSVWKLADRALGYASGHGCAATPSGLVEGIEKALRFDADHPALRGADRADRAPLPEASVAAWPPHIEDLVGLVATRPRASAVEIARELASGDLGSERQRVADVFVAQELGRAIENGLLPREGHWRRAALNYCYTGFAIPFRVPEPSNSTGLEWEPLARHLTRFMLAVAASDEEITDRVLPGETEEARRARVAASGHFLSIAARGEGVIPPPGIDGAEVLSAIAAELGAIRDRFQGWSHPRVFEGYCRAVEALYRANLSELSPDVAKSPLLRRLGKARGRRGVCGAIERRYAAGAPACVADRIRALCAAVEGADDARATRALRLVCYLRDVAPSIGAGATFRAAALWAPARRVTEAMATALDRVATLADYRFRLANDLTDLAASADRDRDAKENAWTILLPARASGKARELALVHAAIACEEAASWLDGELRLALGDLGALWPSLGAMVKRGIQVGGRFYSMGHYADLSRAEASAILDDLEIANVTSLAPKVDAAPPPARSASITRAA